MHVIFLILILYIIQGEKMKRKKGRTKQIILLVLIVEVLLIIFMLCYIQFRSKVVKVVTIEAGPPLTSAELFLRDKNIQDSTLMNMNSLDFNNPGSYEVQIKVGNKMYTSTLKIVDTVPPSATVVNQLILKDAIIEAKDFVSDISDSTAVTVSYKETPDFSKYEDQEVTVVLEDTSNNKKELKATLTVLDINSTVTIEAGSLMDITIADFVNNDKYNVSFETDLQKLDISKPTIHEIVLNVDGKTAKANIQVIDTTAPTATMGNLEIWKGESPQAISFVTNIVDVTSVKASYIGTPDFTLLGEQAVNIIIEDESGNKAELTALIIVKEDTQAPVIAGVVDRIVNIGKTVSYKSGVSVTDNKDELIDFKVDSSQVNLREVGSYQVTYTATDTSGNKATVTATIDVTDSGISEEEVAKMSQDILDEIMTEDMTKVEIAWEIYQWTKGHISYTGSSDKSDWVAEAYRGIKNGVGDCFTYFAVAQALLNQADIDNIGVTRVGGETHHYWSLIDCGDGWYHFDSCPNKDHKKTFMMTDAEVEEYTQMRGNNYYTFDKTLYPPTPLE